MIIIRTSILRFKYKNINQLKKNNIQYEFFQVNGLDKINYEKLTFTKIINNINNFIQYSKQDFNLLIFVTRCGSIHQSTKDEYMMFANEITMKKIPVIGVITNCENSEPMSKWIDKKYRYFSKK